MRDWKITLAAAWVAQFLCIAGFSASMPFLPFYVRELGITDLHQVELWSGTLVSAGAVAMALVSPVWGMLADRYGRKLMVRRSTFGGAVVVASMALVGNVQQLLVLRILQGTLTGTVVAFMTLIAALAPPQQIGFSLGLMQVAVYMGASVGPLVGGLVADHLGYRWAFVVTGVLLLLGGILAHVFIQEKFTRPASKDSSASLATTARIIIRSLPVLGAILALGGISLANAVPGPILPLFVETLQHSAARVNTATGTVYGASAVAGAVAAALLGRLGDRVGYRRILLACGVGLALAYVGQSLAPNLGILIAASLGSGLCISGGMAAANATLARSAPKGQQGAIYGLSNSVGSAAVAIGPMLSVTVATALGLRASFGMAAALAVLVTLCVALTIKPQKIASIAAGDGEPPGADAC